MNKVAYRVSLVIASIVAFAGFFLLFGTAGTIDRLPADQLPTGQMIFQSVAGAILLGGSCLWLNRIYRG